MEIIRINNGFILSTNNHQIRVEFDIHTDGQPIAMIFEDDIPDPIFIISSPSNNNLWKVAYRLASQDLRLCAY